MPNSIPSPDDVTSAETNAAGAGAGLGSGPPHGAHPGARASELLALLDRQHRSEPDVIPGQEPLF